MATHKFYFGDWVHSRKYRKAWRGRSSSKMTDAVFLKEIKGYGFIIFKGSKTSKKIPLDQIYSGWINLKVVNESDKDGLK